MRLFQNSAVYPAYLPRLRTLTKRAGATSFAEQRSVFLADRFGACHFLQPVLQDSPDAFFTNGDDEILQHQWAREQGMRAGTSLQDILLAQIEHHRTEVFYNMDPVRYPSDFIRRLPSSVRRTVAWRAAPSPGADFGAYDLVVCNFESILQGYRDRGWKVAWFAPAHDPEMDAFAASRERPHDIVFVGGYTRHHRNRAELLEAVAALSGEFNVAIYLDRSRLTKLAESPLGRLLPLARHRRPRNIQKASRPPVFGRDLYAALGSAKIVLNGAIDMAARDRGNMRCFESMGCGALMLSDDGIYPPGMEAGNHFRTYADVPSAISQLRDLLADSATRTRMATAGTAMVREEYSKIRQWERFNALC
jgi:hypothetical protein